MRQLSLFDEVVPQKPAVVPPTEGAHLRDYQGDVLNRGRAHMKAGRKRGIIQAETGSGKTFIAAEIARCAAEKCKRTLIMADRRKLVKQMGNALHAFHVPYGVIMSDDTRHTHLPTITASRDTLNAWNNRQMKMPDPFDIVIIDECHKTRGDIYVELLKLWPESCLIGLTATPARGDGKRLDKIYQWLECAVPSSELIRRGWLVQPEVYWPKELAKARKTGKRKGELAGDPVAHWQLHALDLPTIAFAGRVQDSIELRDRFLAAGIAAEHVDADTPDKERERCYERLANGDTKILCSVGLLIEGIDIEEVSCILLWKKFGSIVEFRQACGRGMRPCPRIGKSRCVILDHSGATGEHGAPGEDIEWSLDSDSTVGDRRKKKVEAGEVVNIVCHGCGAMYAAKPACPFCNEPAPRQKKKPIGLKDMAAQRDEILSRFEGTDQEMAREWARSEANNRIFNRCVAVAIHKNGTYKMVMALFRQIAGCWPSDAGIEEPPQEDRNKQARELFPGFVRDKQKATP